MIAKTANTGNLSVILVIDGHPPDILIRLASGRQLLLDCDGRVFIKTGC
jgi:hypothetical protein